MLVKNRNVGQKSTFWSEIEIFVKNRKFDQIKMRLYQNDFKIFGKNYDFSSTSDFWIKFEMFSNIFLCLPTTYGLTIEYNSMLGA